VNEREQAAGVIRVVHVNDKLSMDGQNPSSVAHLLGGWIPELHRLGVACSVCTLRDPDPGARYLDKRGIRVRRFGHGRHSPSNLRAITQLLREEGAAIAHLHGFGAADFGRVITHRLGIANVVHEHATLDMPLHQRLADRLLSGWTDAAVAVSASVRDFMVRERSIPAGRIHVIANGVDLARFGSPPVGAVAAMRETLLIPDAHRVVGVVTRLRREKGTEFFMRAVPHILEQEAGITFLIAGEGPLREALAAAFWVSATMCPSCWLCWTCS
jgi:glycosyltransferase involved in cell wall biosynthesis